MFRNLFHIFRRFTMASILNLLGLSIAFASFLIIMVQVHYETSFDKCQKDADRIFRLECRVSSDAPFYAINARPMEKVLKNSPHVQETGLHIAESHSLNLTYEDGTGSKNFTESCIPVTPGYAKMFSFHMTEGSVDAIDEPGQLLIPESLAEKFFGNKPAIGAILIDKQGSLYTVGGVYRNFPQNTTVRNAIYCQIDDYMLNDWGTQNSYIYLLLDSPKAVDGLLESIRSQINLMAMAGVDMEGPVSNYMRLNPLKELHYSSEVKFSPTETGSRQTTFLLVCIAFIILLIAGINFANFSTALAPMRIKNINTRKVLGSSSEKLRVSLVMEAVCIAFCSFLIAMGITALCHGTFIEGFISTELNLGNIVPILVATGAISIATGFLVGLYPAYYLTSFSPALVLKGSFGLSLRGRRLRSFLLGVQYVSSIVLLIIASFMIIQNKYMINSDFGYNKEQVLIANVDEHVISSHDAFVNALKQNANIEDAAYSYVEISCRDDYSRWGMPYEGNKITFNSLIVSREMPHVLGLPITDGRDFTKSDTQTEMGALVFNQTARDQFGLELGKEINGARIVGFMPDFKYTTFRTTPGPMAFFVSGTYKWAGTYPSAIYYIRITPNAPYAETCSFISETLRQYGSIFTDVRNLDEDIEYAYRKEQDTSSLITLFSIIAILISVVGIFGLVIFETSYKRKEIGVRKVFGSTTTGIMKMFTMLYLKMILVCTIVAAPISYYVVTKWLASFTYRTPIYWWVFVLAFLAIAFVTLATVTYQNYRAASANPAESVKGE